MPDASVDWRYAKHPYLPGARETVAAMDIDVGEIIAGGHAAVDRASQRVQAVIDEGTTGTPVRDACVELLSYPIARILVSLADEPALRERHPRAEAATATDRLQAAAGTSLSSTARTTIDDVLPALDLSESIDRTGETPRVAVGAYLDLAPDAPDWALVERPVADGWVVLADADEVAHLVERAIERRVAGGLPVDVPEALAAALADEMAVINGKLAPPDPPTVAAGALDGFTYPCPACRSATVFHAPRCRFVAHDREAIQQAYVGIAAILDAGPRDRDALRETLGRPWTPLHDAALDALEREYRVDERDDGTYALLEAEEREERLLVPSHDALRTIYEQGSVPGAHDNSVFALISYYEMVGLDWETTREAMLDWLHDSGTWERGGFDESSPEALLTTKKHVFEEGYGWKDKARAAARVIERASIHSGE
jgi:hypothetical protein